MPAKTGRKKKNPALDELLALLPALDEAGIAFLLEQAKVHRYNMEVERLNAQIESDAVRGPDSVPGPAPGLLRIERSKDGSTYHLVVGNDWKMFTSEEMAALVRICRSGEPQAEMARRLRAWLSRERRDVYLDLGLDGPSIGMGLDLVRLIGESFPLPAAKPG